MQTAVVYSVLDIKLYSSSAQQICPWTRAMNMPTAIEHVIVNLQKKKAALLLYELSKYVTFSNYQCKVRCTM